MPEVGVTKIRIGVGLGVHTSSDPSRFAALVDGLEALGFDSLWLSERITADSPDPLTAPGLRGRPHLPAQVRHQRHRAAGPQPHAAGQDAWPRSTSVSSGRSPARGRPRRDQPERAAGLQRGPRRAAVALRRDAAADAPLLERGPGRPQGQVVPLRGCARCGPQPAQKPLEVWLGGIAPSALRPLRPAGRRLAAVVRHARRRAPGAAPTSSRWPPGPTVRSTTATSGPSCPTCNGYIPDELAEMVRKRRPDVEVTDVVAKDLVGAGAAARALHRGRGVQVRRGPRGRARQLGRPRRRHRRRRPPLGELARVPEDLVSWCVTGDRRSSTAYLFARSPPAWELSLVGAS